MATITPNRRALKDLSMFNIDAQFCQQYGTQVFNYSGEVTPQYQEMCTILTDTLDDLMADIESIRAELPSSLRNAD